MADVQIKLGIKFLDSDIETSAITKQVQQAINTAIAKTDLSQLKKKIASLNKSGTGKGMASAIRDETKALADQEKTMRRATKATQEYGNAKAVAGGKKPWDKNDITILSAKNQKMRELGKSFQNAGMSAALFGARIAEIGKRFSGFFVWTTLLFKFMEAVRFTAQAVKELDTTAVSLAKVLRTETKQSIDALTYSLLAMATETRRTFTEVSDAMKGFVRTGLTASEALKATKAAMDLLNVSTVDAVTAQKLLTTTVNSMNISWDEAGQKVAVFSDLADRNAVVVKDLAQGFIRAGATASAFGITTEELGAMIATVAGKTQLAANRIGTAFKTLFVNTAKNREQIISLTAAYSGNTTTLTQLNSQYDTVAKTLQFVAKNWNMLSAAQRTALGRMVGGARRFTEFAALMEGSAKYQDNLRTAMEKSNSVQRKSAIEAQSLEAAHRSLQTAIAKFAKLLEGIGATTFYKTLVTGLGQSIGLMTKLIKNTDDWAQQLEGGFGFFKDGLSSLNLLKNAVIVLFAKVFLPFIKQASLGFVNFMTANQRGIQKLIGIEQERQAREQKITQEYTRQNVALQDQIKLLKQFSAIQSQRPGKMGAALGGTGAQATVQYIGGADKAAKNLKGTFNELNSTSRGLKNSMVAQIGGTIAIMQALDGLAGGLDQLSTASAEAGNHITSAMAKAGSDVTRGASMFAAFGAKGLLAGAIMGSLTSIMSSFADKWRAANQLAEETKKASRTYISSIELAARAQSDYALTLALLRDNIAKIDKGNVVIDLSKLPTVVNFETFQAKATGPIRNELEDIQRRAEIFKVEMAEAQEKISAGAKSAKKLSEHMAEMAAIKVGIEAKGFQVALPALTKMEQSLAKIEARDISVSFGKGLSAVDGMVKPLEYMRKVISKIEAGTISAADGMADFHDKITVDTPQLEALNDRFRYLTDRINEFNEEFTYMQRQIESPLKTQIDIQDFDKLITNFKTVINKIRETSDGIRGIQRVSIGAVEYDDTGDKEREKNIETARDLLLQINSVTGANTDSIQEQIEYLTAINKEDKKYLSTQQLLDKLAKEANQEQKDMIQTIKDGLGLNETMVELNKEIKDVTKESKDNIAEQALELLQQAQTLSLITSQHRESLGLLQSKTQELQQAQAQWQQIAMSAALHGKSINQSAAAMQKYGVQLKLNTKEANKLKEARDKEIAALKNREDLSKEDIKKAVEYVEVQFDIKLEKMAQKRMKIIGDLVKAQIDRVRDAAKSLKKSLDNIVELRGGIRDVDKEIAQFKQQLRDIDTGERDNAIKRQLKSTEREFELVSNVFVTQMKEVAKALKEGRDEANRYIVSAKRELGLTKTLTNVFGEIAIASETAAYQLMTSENSIVHIRAESAQASLDIFKSEYEKLKGFGESLYAAGPSQLRKLAQANALLQNSTLSMSDTLAQMPIYLRDAAAQILKLRFGERGEEMIARAGLERAGISTDALDDLKNKTVNAIYTVAKEQLQPLEEQVVEQKKTNEIMEKYLGKSFMQQEAFLVASESSNEKLDEMSKGQSEDRASIKQQLRDAIERKKLLQAQLVQETNSAQAQERIILSLNPGMRTLTDIMPQQLSAAYQMIDGIKANTAAVTDLSTSIKTQAETGADITTQDEAGATIDTSQITTSLNELASVIISNTSAVNDSAVAIRTMSGQISDLRASYISHTPILNKIVSNTIATKTSVDSMRSGTTLAAVVAAINNVVAAIKALNIQINVTVKNVVNKYSAAATRATGLSTPEIGSLVAAARREKAKMPLGAELVLANSSELVMTPKQAAKIFGQVNIPDRGYVAKSPAVQIEGVENINSLMKKIDTLFTQQQTLLDMAENKQLFTTEQNIKIDVAGKREVRIKGIAEMGRELEQIFKKNMAKVSTKAEHMALKSTLNYLIRRLREMGIDGV